MQLASELAAWNAKCKVLADAGSTAKPSGKAGNVVPRMWAKTGWWPLKRKSETWKKAISQFYVGDRPVVDLTDPSQELTTELGPDVKIRQVVLNAFRNGFLKAAQDVKAAYASKNKRNTRSVPCTVYGKGFTKGEDLTVVKENDIRIEAREQAKV